VTGSTLAVLSSLDFPQVLASAIDRQVTRTLNLYAESHLNGSSYESPESLYGARDGLSYIAKATVHHLELEQDLCLEHFREVSRG
jgi:hypothetical protein